MVLLQAFAYTKVILFKMLGVLHPCPGYDGSFFEHPSGLAKSPARCPGATRNFSRATAISLLMSRQATMPLLDI